MDRWLRRSIRAFIAWGDNMRVRWIAVGIAAAATLSAAQAPTNRHEVLKAKVDLLLDSVRANDEARFATLVGRIFSDEPPVDPDEGPLLGDYAADPIYYGPLTLASLRRFARDCRYTGPDSDLPQDPLRFHGLYNCSGEAGHTMGVHFSADARLAVWITIMSPQDHAELASQNARIAAADAISAAAERAEVMRVAGTVDALFAAAAAGDQARFNELLGEGFEGGGPVLSDERAGVRRAVPLTLEALRPIAAACRRGEEEPYQAMNMSDQIIQEGPLVCGGEAGMRLIAVYEQNGTRVASLVVEGRVRLPWP
jgi:hypothetical protein